MVQKEAGGVPGAYCLSPQDSPDEYTSQCPLGHTEHIQIRPGYSMGAEPQILRSRLRRRLHCCATSRLHESATTRRARAQTADFTGIRPLDRAPVRARLTGLKGRVSGSRREIPPRINLLVVVRMVFRRRLSRTERAGITGAAQTQGSSRRFRIDGRHGIDRGARVGDRKPAKARSDPHFVRSECPGGGPGPRPNSSRRGAGVRARRRSRLLAEGVGNNRGRLAGSGDVGTAGAGSLSPQSDIAGFWRRGGRGSAC